MKIISATGIVLCLTVFFPPGTHGESLTVVNRTGGKIDLIQTAPVGADNWGDDLIPGTVLLDGESTVIDLIGNPPWSFRLLDSGGTAYVLYEVPPPTSGKIIVGPEHQARLSQYAGIRRRVHITNDTGMTVFALRISHVASNVWGADVLKGRTIRDGEKVVIDFDATAGSLSFDLQFVLTDGRREISYEKNEVILTDGASLILRQP